jgi:hypothetical protein
MSRIVVRFHLRPRDLLIPPQPDPWRENNARRVNRARIESLVGVLRKADPLAARQLAQMADLRFGTLQPR